MAGKEVDDLLTAFDALVVAEQTPEERAALIMRDVMARFGPKPRVEAKAESKAEAKAEHAPAVPASASSSPPSSASSSPPSSAAATPPAPSPSPAPLKKWQLCEDSDDD